MRRKEMYRLGEYLITLSDNGQIEWQAHAALGMERSGKCFILENILIFGQCRDEDHGYLKMEFHDHLRKLPPWTKTAYYCSSVNLRDVLTGRVVTEDFLQEITTLAQIKGPSVNSATEIIQGAFRLGQYNINVTADGNITWQSIEGINKVIGGPCRIESHVLFICPQEYVQENQNKHDFLNKLQQLPQWDKTVAWCRSMVLQDCQPQQQTEHFQTVVTTENMWHKVIHGRPSRNNKEQLDEATTRRGLSAGFKQLPSLWHRILRGKALSKYLMPTALIVIGLFLGLTMVFYYVGKGCHMAHWDDDHHHKHDHEED